MTAVVKTGEWREIKYKNEQKKSPTGGGRANDAKHWLNKMNNNAEKKKQRERERRTESVAPR